MGRSDFDFLVYRLNIVDIEKQLKLFKSPISTNDQIIEILKAASFPKYDIEKEYRRSLFRWSLRNFILFQNGELPQGPIAIVFLARSLLERRGRIVTSDTIVEGTSTSSPALAQDIVLIFYMQRHLVLVEYNSSIMISKLWKKLFTDITKDAAIDLGLSSNLCLEPVSKNHQLIDLFRSFSKLTELKVRLRLPNPEITGEMEELFKKLRNGGIREYYQEMKNYRGLSQEEGELPDISVKIAEVGYKDGEVEFAGTKDGKQQRLKSGEQAARSQIVGLRDCIRGMLTMAKTKEAQKALEQVLTEVDQIVQKPN